MCYMVVLFCLFFASSAFSNIYWHHIFLSVIVMFLVYSLFHSLVDEMSEHSISMYISYLYCIGHELPQTQLKGYNYTTGDTVQPELFTLPGHPKFASAFRGDHVARSFVCRALWTIVCLLSFSFGHCILLLIPSHYLFGIEQETLKQWQFNQYQQWKSVKIIL